MHCNILPCKISSSSGVVQGRLCKQRAFWTLLPWLFAWQWLKLGLSSQPPQHPCCSPTRGGRGLHDTAKHVKPASRFRGGTGKARRCAYLHGVVVWLEGTRQLSKKSSCKIAQGALQVGYALTREEAKTQLRLWCTLGKSLCTVPLFMHTRTKQSRFLYTCTQLLIVPKKVPSWLQAWPALRYSLVSFLWGSSGVSWRLSSHLNLSLPSFCLL